MIFILDMWILLLLLGKKFEMNTGVQIGVPIKDTPISRLAITDG